MGQLKKHWWVESWLVGWLAGEGVSTHLRTPVTVATNMLCISISKSAWKGTWKQPRTQHKISRPLYLKKLTNLVLTLTRMSKKNIMLRGKLYKVAEWNIQNSFKQLVWWLQISPWSCWTLKSERSLKSICILRFWGGRTLDKVKWHRWGLDFRKYQKMCLMN